VFTARYALSPYIKQIRFVFKGLKNAIRVWAYFSCVIITVSLCSTSSISHKYLFNAFNLLVYKFILNHVLYTFGKTDKRTRKAGL
jgi:hypothetical protein